VIEGIKRKILDLERKDELMPGRWILIFLAVCTLVCIRSEVLHCHVAFLLFFLSIHSCPYVGLSFEDVVIGLLLCSS